MVGEAMKILLRQSERISLTERVSSPYQRSSVVAVEEPDLPPPPKVWYLCMVSGKCCGPSCLRHECILCAHGVYKVMMPKKLHNDTQKCTYKDLQLLKGRSSVVSRMTKWCNRYQNSYCMAKHSLH